MKYVKTTYHEFPGIDVVELNNKATIGIDTDGDTMLIAVYRSGGDTEPIAWVELCAECGAHGDHPFDCPTFVR